MRLEGAKRKNTSTGYREIGLYRAMLRVPENNKCSSSKARADEKGSLMLRTQRASLLNTFRAKEEALFQQRCRRLRKRRPCQAAIGNFTFELSSSQGRLRYETKFSNSCILKRPAFPVLAWSVIWLSQMLCRTGLTVGNLSG